MARKPRGYWTKERILEAAKKCKTRKEFYLRFQGALCVAKKDGYLDECYAHMGDPILTGHLLRKWHKENVLPLALECETRSEFKKKYPSAQGAARRDGYLDEVCAHMTKKGSRHERAIYALEFPDNSVYVGLTYDYDIRFRSHEDKSSNRGVRERMDRYSYYCQVRFDIWMSPEEAVLEEHRIRMEYVDNGFEVLNIHKTGASGSTGGTTRTWPKDRVMEVALSCSTRVEFSRCFPGAWAAASKEGYLDECIAHMGKKISPWDAGRTRRWTKEAVLKAARKCKSRGEFGVKFPGARAAAKKDGYLNECYDHMNHTRVERGTWTKENVIKEARKYNNRDSFKWGSSGAWSAASKGGYLDECYTHMTEVRHWRGYWTKARVLEVARSCETRSDFYKSYQSAYNVAKKKGFLAECYAHMEKRNGK